MSNRNIGRTCRLILLESDDRLLSCVVPRAPNLGVYANF